MTNVMQFTPRAKPAPAIVAEVQPKGERKSPVGEVPQEPVHPWVGVPLIAAEPVNLPPSIAATAAGQVIQALVFYARRGFDDGKQAKLALTAMQTVLSARG